MHGQRNRRKGTLTACSTHYNFNSNNYCWQLLAVCIILALIMLNPFLPCTLDLHYTVGNDIHC